jgi:hypothetical protein
VPTCASKMRMLVPSFGAVLIGCHSNDMAPSPVLPLTQAVDAEFRCLNSEKGSLRLKSAL